MKQLTILFILLTTSQIQLFGQQAANGQQKTSLQKVYINEDVSLHFISPEPIQYVDISTKNLIGNIPIENVFRIKAVKDSIDYNVKNNSSLGVITIIGQKFIAQFDLWYSPHPAWVQTQIEINPLHTNPLDIGAIPLSKSELRLFAIEAFKKKRRKNNVYSTSYGISGRVNNVFTFDDYIFLDISYSNKTNLVFDIDQVRFKIEDKKITKATNVQSIEIEPVYQLIEKKEFKGVYRNIYAIRKFSFPNNKILSIELTESQISGRTLLLQLDYSDILTADTL